MDWRVWEFAGSIFLLQQPGKRDDAEILNFIYLHRLILTKGCVMWPNFLKTFFSIACQYFYTNIIRH